MAKNITLSVEKYEYEEGRKNATATGHVYTVKLSTEGVSQVDRVNKANLSQFDAVDSALLETLKRASKRYYDVNVTIEGASFPESLQTFLIDKYETETQFTSVSFA